MLAAQSQIALSESPPRALLLAAESVMVFPSEPPRAGEQALRDSLARIGGIVLSGYRGVGNMMEFSANGQWIAIAGRDDPDIRVWQLGDDPAPRHYATLHGHNATVSCLRFSPDGQWLASASWGGEVHLWNLNDTDAEVHPIVLRQHGPAIYEMEICSGSRWLVAGGSTGDVFVWDLADKNDRWTARTLAEHKGRILRLFLDGDSGKLVTTSVDGNACVSNLYSTDVETIKLQITGSRAFAADVSKDGRWLATTGNCGPDDTEGDQLRLWDLDAVNNSQTCNPLVGHDTPVSIVRLAPNGHWLVSASVDGEVRLWDLSRGLPERSEVLCNYASGEVEACFSPDGHWLLTRPVAATATRDSDTEMHLWDFSANCRPEHPISIRVTQDAVWRAQFDPASRYLIVTGPASDISVWDLFF